jgi:cytochrome c peroxidase
VRIDVRYPSSGRTLIVRGQPSPFTVQNPTKLQNREKQVSFKSFRAPFFWDFRAKQQQRQQNCPPNKTTMKRGAIATLASLAVLATVGPIGGASAAAVVAQQKQPSQFSDRFLASLEEADANVEEENTNSKALMEVGDDRRRKLSWWSLALMFSE